MAQQKKTSTELMENIKVQDLWRGMTTNTYSMAHDDDIIKECVMVKILLD